MIRITPQMMMSRYKRNVSDAFASMNKAMERAYTYRSFDRPSDNPLAASQTFEVHWQMSLNSDYSTNVQNLQGVSNTADSILQNIDSLLTEADKTDTLKGIDGSMNDDGRKTIADNLLHIRDSIVAKLNAKYGDSYVFGGANSSEAPFRMIGDQLYYRGINVDTGENQNGASVVFSDGTKSTQVDFGEAIGGHLNGYTLNIQTSQGTNDAVFDEGAKTITVNVTGTSLTKGDLQAALNGLGTRTLADGTNLDFTKASVAGNAGDQVNVPASGSSGSITDVADLDALANEKVYVDIGLGITTTDGKIDDQSAFNGAMPGIAYLGYGTHTVTNDDGTTTEVPNNLCSLLTKVADLLQNHSETSNSDLVRQVQPYTESFETSQTKFEAGQAELGQQMNFLSDTASYLSDIKTNLSDKDNQVEYVDYTDAIEEFYTQQYCYSASLKVGSQILQQSLMDYLK